jgi:hypothetical protein
MGQQNHTRDKCCVTHVMLLASAFAAAVRRKPRTFPPQWLGSI